MTSESGYIVIPVFALLTAGYFLFFYVLATFRYRVTDRSIEMRWTVLGFVPVSRRTIALDEVEGAAAMPFLRCLTSGKGFHVFGNVFARRGATLLLEKGVLWSWFGSFGRIIYVTPRDPEAFVAQVTSALRARASVASDPQ